MADALTAELAAIRAREQPRDVPRLADAMEAATEVHRQHVSETRPGQSFSPTFPPPGICVHDHWAWPCPTVRAITRALLGEEKPDACPGGC